ncbi:MAG: RNA-binding S4 domain-containing protein [Syntrophomonadaceae bacterium]|nr:RNA-binding S4 domain-containing protein [Syntrophomonadaceae bacterium]
MRLDKYLKVSRLIKRRSVAKEFAENARVTLNGRIAKPSTEVKIGDLLAIQMGNRKVVVEILEIKSDVRSGEAQNLYRVIDEQPPPA